jgi:pectin methylesterase-like acyl-CoA thioesterase
MIHNTIKKQCGLNLAVAILVIAMPASTQAQTPEHMAPSPPQGLAVIAGPVDEEFVGPFASWDNIKTRYGAKGDGSSDDTAAFQAAFDQVGRNGSSPVVYIPSGTYVIKSTLLLTNRFGVSFIGEDPGATVIQWGGATGGTMAWFDGVHTSTLERMTWDGSGAAAIGIKFFKTGTYPINGSHIDHRDMIYKDMTSIGVQGGDMPPGHNDDQHLFIRNKFIRCGEGIGLRSWNALLYLVMDSEFIDNGFGIRANPGSFNAYRNVFRNSTVVDIAANDAGANGIRNNVSIGSKRFLVGYGRLAVQGNTVIDPKTSPVIDLAGEDLMMVDNVVTAATDGTGPILKQSFAFGNVGTAVVVGNTFTSANTYSLSSAMNARLVDNRVVSRSEIPAPAAALPPTPAKTTRPIIEVPAGADGQAIQSAIDQAVAQYTGRRPIIHLPWSQYVVRSTLVIPPNSDIELLGDNLGQDPYGTKLSWGGAATTAPLLQIQGPTHVKLTRFSISGGNSYLASGIVVTNADQPGSQVMLTQSVYEVLEHAVWLHGLKNSKVDIYMSDMTSGNTYDRQQTTVASAVRVDGAGPGTTSRVVTYGAGVLRDNNSAFDVPVVEVFNQGRALLYDGWDECCSPRKVFLTGQNDGTLTYWGSLFANRPAFAYPWVEVDGFHGMLSLFGVNMTDKSNPVVIRSEATDTDVLVLQANTYPPLANPLYSRLSTGGQVSFVQRIANGTLLPDSGDPLTNARLLAHLALPRTVVPSRPQAVAAGVTDFRMDRVNMARTRTGIELRPGQ